MLEARLAAIPKWLLFLIGLWTIDLKKNNSIYSTAYKTYSTFTKAAYCTFVVSLLIQLAVLITENDDLKRVISSVTVLILVLENAIKYVIYEQHQIPDMINDIFNNERSIWKSRVLNLQKLYKREVKFCRVINLIQIIVMALLLVISITNSIVTTFEHNHKPFLYDSWYPFNHNMTLIVVLHMYYAIMGMIINIATLTTFATLIVFSTIKLRLLKIRIKNIIGTNQFQMTGYVKDLIREHQYVIRFVKLLNERTRNVTLLDFLFNTCNLTMSVMQSLTETDSIGRLFAMSIFLLTISEIIIFSWISNELKLQSIEVANAIYESEWYEQNKETKRLLHIMMLRAQKPLFLGIGPFRPLTNETALTMLKAAYTYLSVMMDSYK